MEFSLVYQFVAAASWEVVEDESHHEAKGQINADMKFLLFRGTLGITHIWKHSSTGAAQHTQHLQQLVLPNRPRRPHSQPSDCPERAVALLLAAAAEPAGDAALGLGGALLDLLVELVDGLEGFCLCVLGVGLGVALEPGCLLVGVRHLSVWSATASPMQDHPLEGAEPPEKGQGEQTALSSFAPASAP